MGLGVAVRTTFTETKEITVIDNRARINIPMFNRILNTNIPTDKVDKTIQDTINNFASKKIPFTWQVDPENQPNDLAVRLERAHIKRDSIWTRAIYL